MTPLPWVIYSRNAIETARHLINQAGGVAEAHEAVKAAAAGIKKSQGRPRKVNDEFTLLMADAIRRDEACTDNAALKKVADLTRAGLEPKARAGLKPIKPNKKDFEVRKTAMVRRLRDKLKGETLAKFAQRWDLVADIVRDPNRVTFVFRVREGN